MGQSFRTKAANPAGETHGEHVLLTQVAIDQDGNELDEGRVVVLSSADLKKVHMFPRTPEGKQDLKRVLQEMSDSHDRAIRERSRVAVEAFHLEPSTPAST